MATALFPVILAAAVALVVITILLVRHVRYRRHIESVLKGEDDSGRKIASQGDAQSSLMFIVFVWSALLLLMVFSMSRKLGAMEDALKNMSHEMMMDRNETFERIKQMNSLLVEHSWGIERLNRGDRSVDIRFRFTLKEYRADTEAVLVIGERSIPLQRDGASLTGSVNAGLFESLDGTARIEIREGDSCRSETLDDININMLWQNMMPDLYLYKTIDDIAVKNGSVTINDSVIVSRNPVKDGTETQKARLVIEVNGTEVFSEEIDLAQADGLEIPIRGSFACTQNDCMAIYIISENDLGLSVKQLEWYNCSEENEQSVLKTVGTRVWDTASGEVLYSE
ncbi:MAG: hypothetical protein K6E50_05510 [Lachnospiraceae bacterium]|nr:hypothetical protein [Lachnospiraceae bacterium]